MVGKQELQWVALELAELAACNYQYFRPFDISASLCRANIHLPPTHTRALPHTSSHSLRQLRSASFQQRSDTTDVSTLELSVETGTLYNQTPRSAHPNLKKQGVPSIILPFLTAVTTLRHITPTWPCLLRFLFVSASCLSVLHFSTSALLLDLHSICPSSCTPVKSRSLVTFQSSKCLHKDYLRLDRVFMPRTPCTWVMEHGIHNGILSCCQICRA